MSISGVKREGSGKCRRQEAKSGEKHRLARSIISYLLIFSKLNSLKLLSSNLNR